MKNIYILKLLESILFTLSLQAIAAQTVSNLNAEYINCQSLINFDLSTPCATDLTLLYSGDGGVTWAPCDSVSGSIENQMTGEKTIVWNNAADGVVYGIFKFKVEATPCTLECGSAFMEMISVEGGTFTMGQSGGQPAVYGPTSAIVNSFCIGKYEVTQAQFKQVMNISNTYPEWTSDYGLGDTFPAYHISWYDAIAFCNKLSIREGRTPVYTVSGVNFNTLTYVQIPATTNINWNNCTQNPSANGYRLPTETEWEYAARGGAGIGFYYAGTNIPGTAAGELGDYAWYRTNNSPGGSKPAGTRQPNGLGIYDMSGNESEWCWDWYQNTYVGGTNPTGSVSGSLRCIRGGCWSDYASSCMVSFRGTGYPYDRQDKCGFRLACSID